MHSFQKMLCNLKFVLVYSLAKFVLEDIFKDSYVMKICETCRNISITEFSVKQVTVQYLESTFFWGKRSAKYNLLGTYEILKITTRMSNVI